MKDRGVSFSISDVTGTARSFTSLRALHKFFVDEKKFWQEQKDRFQPNQSANHSFLNAAAHFENALNTMQGWQEKLDSWSDDQLNAYLSQLKQQNLGNTPGQWLWSGQPSAEPFVQCLLEYGVEAAEGFVDIVIRGQVNNIQNVQRFKGLLMGYEFLMQDSSITKRRVGEKVALGHLRTQFADAQDSLFKEVEKLKSEFDTWSSSSKEKHERLFSIQKRLGERKIRQQGKSYTDQLKNWAHALANLEATYQEKLRLEKPAQYWAKAAERYGRQGGYWLLLLVALVIAGVLSFQNLFVVWLEGKELPLKLNSFQGIVLFASIASVYAYLMRAASRLTFSSFHLMRDAQEREQLTYLYLSLANETSVDEKSREIILQSLFSRSETGLLAQEHGPSMPTLGEAMRASSQR